MLSSSSSLFTSLPARPPTPPRDVQEHVQNALDFLENGHEEADQDGSEASKRQLSTDTPPVSSPASSVGAPAGSNATKKVGFSPFPPTFHEVPNAGVSSSPRDRLLRSTPRPRNTKPVKSILKLSSFAPPPTPDDQEQRLGYFSPDDPASFGKMLESVLKELASSSKSSRLDAYLAIHGALTAYDGIPDRQAMATNMSQFQQYLSRDLMWRDSSGLIDTQIATQALKLACTMVFDTQLSKAMDDEFRVFLIDRSITVMEQPDMPKALVKTHLYLVAQQKFHQSIITPNRADRMISALRTIEERCSSNSLIATRLVIYQRLLDQAPAVMSARLKDWLEHVFHGMLSSINDTRTRAIEVGNHAGLLLGTNPAASKALHDLFETEVEEGQCYCDYLTLRLTSMIGDKEKQSGVLVPQIWSAVVLFFRTKRRPLDKWPRLRTWLQVLQKCLNSSDVAIKSQANLAWKKLVFAVMPDASTGSTMLSMLKVPIKAGFEKRNSDRSGKQARQFALDGYHNLLHYSMRPSLTHADLDVTWDAYVAPILSEMIEASHKGRVNACNILYGLLSPNSGVWNEYAALDVTAIRSHDLPRLDPRWVRTRLNKVLALVEPIVSAGLWATEEESLMTAKLWQSTLQSIAEAGAQEVRTSNELREAIALVMNMFQRLWKSSCVVDLPEAATASTKFQELMRTTCHYIGPSLLAEDILARTPQGDAEAAPTPSQRPSKHQHVLYSPLIFTLTMMCCHMHSGGGQRWRSMAAEVVELACKSKATSAARLQLLNRTSQAIKTNCVSVDAKEQAATLWSIFAERATEALQHSKTESTPTGTLGQKLRDALSIVVCGLPIMHSHSEETTARSLIEEIVAVARCKASDAGVILAAIEPLSKALLDKDALIDSTTGIRVATILLRSAGWPQNRQSMEQGRKTLWGVGSGPHRAGTFDPYEHLYALAKDTSRDAYSKMHSDTSRGIDCPNMLSALSSFVGTCPPSLLVNTLRQIQEALVIWVEDDERHVFTSGDLAVARPVTKLWDQLLRQLTDLPRKDGSLLSLLQPIMIAGFVSPKRAIVNRTIAFWNECFGELDSLRYPSKLERVLRAARTYVELDLPDFPETAPGEDHIDLPAFSGPQDEDTQIDSKSSSSTRWTGLPQGTASPVKRATPASIDESSRLATIETGGTSSASKSNSKGMTTRARLRHDNSQILFAPIESSPLPVAEDSQLLTDHQKEVRARQVEGAQMFPDISSTPVKKSTPHSRRKTPGTLDFSANAAPIAADSETLSTPMDVTEAHGEMSGYMGSSPTPRSSDKPCNEHLQLEGAPDHLEEEPSSSPPRSPEQDKDAWTADVENHEDDFVADSVPPVTRLSKKFDKQMPQNSDLPSDTILPAQQLQHEAHTAEIQANNTASSQHMQSQVDATTVIDPTEMIEQSTSGGSDHGVNDDTSRIENSFVERRESPDPIAEPSPSDSQYMSRSGRKRKRVNDVADNSAAKKQKHQSPFRRVFSGIFGRSQQEDEDVGDEIVVASSQPSESPAAQKVFKTEKTEETPKDTQESAISSQKPKRGRGRPRKSETPTPVPAPAPAPAIPLACSTRLKRRASALSEADDTSEVAASEVKATPVLKRQRRRSKAKKAIEEARGSQDQPGSRPSSRREATAVVIEKPDADVEVSQTRMATDDEDASGEESQEKTDDIVATPSRSQPKDTPKSILGRLRDILGDCRNAIFGSQEERDFDNVLFELRREVHGAAARGRQT